MPLLGSSSVFENKSYQEWTCGKGLQLGGEKKKDMQKLYIISNTCRLPRLYLGQVPSAFIMALSGIVRHQIGVHDQFPTSSCF